MEKLNEKFLEAIYDCNIVEAKKCLDQNFSFFYSIMNIFSKKYNIQFKYKNNNPPYNFKGDYNFILQYLAARDKVDMINLLLTDTRLKKYQTRTNIVLLVSRASIDSNMSVLEYLYKKYDLVNDESIVTACLTLATRYKQIKVLNYLILDLNVKKNQFDLDLKGNIELINSIFEKQDLKNRLEKNLEIKKDKNFKVKI